jgi:hypothetical protein
LHPELRFKQAALQVANVEYEKALEANKKAPGSITQSEIRRLGLMVERAAADLELLKHNLAVPAAATTPQTGNAPVGTTFGSSLILRSAEQFRERLRQAQGHVDLYAEQVKRGVGKGNLEAQRQLQVLQVEYAAQLRLLELEVLSAQRTLEAAKSQFDIAHTLNQQGEGASLAEVTRRKLEADQAQVRLEQLETLYELYREVGKTGSEEKAKPQSEPPASEPERARQRSP